MNIKDVHSANQLNWDFNTNSFGACANAANRIAQGETVRFDVFTRPKNLDKIEMKFKQTFYFGLMQIEGQPALRVSHCPDLDANGSHSLIPSWNPQAANPVFISASLCMFLTGEGSDWFIDTKIV